MNELARAVHDVVNGNAKLDAELVSRLSPQERTALAELESLLRRSPGDLAALLAQDGPTAVWFGPAPTVSRSSAS